METGQLCIRQGNDFISRREKMPEGLCLLPYIPQKKEERKFLSKLPSTMSRIEYLININYNGLLG
jgi:hypothetical protein